MSTNDPGPELDTPRSMDGPNGPIPLFVGSIPTAAFNLFNNLSSIS